MSNNSDNNGLIPFLVVVAAVVAFCYSILKSMASSIGLDVTALLKVLVVGAAFLFILGWATFQMGKWRAARWLIPVALLSTLIPALNYWAAGDSDLFVANIPWYGNGAIQFLGVLIFGVGGAYMAWRQWDDWY